MKTFSKIIQYDEIMHIIWFNHIMRYMVYKFDYKPNDCISFAIDFLEAVEPYLFYLKCCNDFVKLQSGTDE